MMIAPLPSDELQRIKDLELYHILDSEKDKNFDDLVELASQICNTPIALITFVDQNRQWFKARKNIEATETSRDQAFCAHTILQNGVMVVADAKRDKRFYDNELVTGELNIGFYAGAPIISSAGYKLGTVCVIDNIMRNDLSPKQLHALEIIASQVSKLLELSVKNKLIAQQAQIQLASEKRISQLIVAEGDKMDGRIAYELHENLAQSLASVKMFLEYLNNKKSTKASIRKNKDILENVIKDIKALSKSITPTTYQLADFMGEIQDFIEDFGEANNMKIDLDIKKVNKNWDSKTGLNLFKIIQNQLSIAKSRAAGSVMIEIQSNKKIILNIREKINPDHNQKYPASLFNNINTRVGLLNGKFNYRSTVDANHLNIEIPMQQVPVHQPHPA